MINLDLNTRIDPLLHDAGSIENETAARVAKIAFPFLCLNGTTGMVASLGMGGVQSWTIVQDIRAHYEEDGWLAFGGKSFHLIIVGTSTALSILLPFGQFAVSNVYQLGINLYTLLIHVWNREGVEAAKVVCQTLHQLIYIASVCLATPEWIALSLVIQTLVEVGQAYRQCSEEGRAHLPEIIASVLLASIRAYSACPYLKTLHRNYFGKQLSQADWSLLYGEMCKARNKNPPSALVDMESLLIEKGISSHIKGINFKTTADLSRVKLSNMYFQKCDFNEVNFERAHFHKIVADSCLFKRTSWINSFVTNSCFNGCNFSFACIVNAQFKDVTILNSDLRYSYFNDSVLDGISLHKCKMQETSFLMAIVRDGLISDSDLTDCLLFNGGEKFALKNCTPNSITKPVVGISWNFRQPGLFTPMIDTALRQHGAIPLRFECMPDDLDPELLDSEVERLIAQVQQAKPKNMLSVPDEILKRAKEGSQLAKVKARATRYLQHCDGLALPGGHDIEPEFYQAKREEFTFTNADMRRSMIEFALVSEAHQNRTPTMGTCRGSQLINVYFGGTLKQHVPGQSGLQPMEFTDSSRKEWIRTLVGDDFHGYSAHHQASDQMGRDLEVVMKAGNINKFFVSRDENFIGSQIHPEIHPSLERERQMVENLMRKGEVTPTEQTREMFAFYDRTIQGNKNIYKFFMEKARKKSGKNVII